MAVPRVLEIRAKVSRLEHKTFSQVAEIEQTSISELTRRMFREMAKHYGLWPPQPPATDKRRNSEVSEREEVHA